MRRAWPVRLWNVELEGIIIGTYKATHPNRAALKCASLQPDKFCFGDGTATVKVWAARGMDGTVWKVTIRMEARWDAVSERMT